MTPCPYLKVYNLREAFQVDTCVWVANQYTARVRPVPDREGVRTRKILVVKPLDHVSLAVYLSTQRRFLGIFRFRR